MHITYVTICVCMYVAKCLATVIDLELFNSYIIKLNLNLIVIIDFYRNKLI